MKNNCFFLLLSVFMLFSCAKVEKASVDRDVMVGILADMHVSDAVLANVNPGNKDSLSRVYLDEILKIHKVKKDDFMSAMKYYESKPEIMEEMYNEVLVRLEEGDSEHQ